MAKRLRSGFTTGACAAAAAKAATLALMEGICPRQVGISFPDGARHQFAVHSYHITEDEVVASIIKDAGDDPDVTNGAEIFASVTIENDAIDKSQGVIIDNIRLCRGQGVGYATKPGLAVAVGEPAINPMPRQMIGQAVREACDWENLVITISVKNGEELAEKTLNHRLGIIGGLSILGTTGIVKPVSAEAWTATIKASLDVAEKTGATEVVFATGRTSEKGAQQSLKLPIEAFVMMGDYLEFSLKEAAARPFARVHLAGMWAKIVKAALSIPQTHVRHGALEVKDAANLLAGLGAEKTLVEGLSSANTAREIYTKLEDAGRLDLIRAVCTKAQQYCESVTGKAVSVYLINHRAEIVFYV